MLTFSIKRQWFNMIVDGIKKEEYRADTPYYRSRLEPYLGQKIECSLRNGYSSTSPTLKISATVEKGTGNPDWGAVPGEIYYKLIIHKFQRIEPETFIIKARRCKRCGGLLTSSKAVKNGMGHTCMMKAKAEEQQLEFEKNQMNLFDVIDQDQM